MRDRSDRWLFCLSVATTAAVTISIAASQILLTVTIFTWLATRSQRVFWPGYMFPLVAFMLTTTASLLTSPDLDAGLPVMGKFVLFLMAPLAVTFITTETRYARFIKVLAAAAVLGSAIGMIQFGGYYSDYLSGQGLDNDVVNLARITGPMGHWMTFSGQQMIILSALLPAGWILGARWHRFLLSVFAITLLLTLTRSVWLGALAASAVAVPYVGSRTLLKLVIPLALMFIVIPALLVQRIFVNFEPEGFPPDRARVDMIDAGIRMIGDHPMLGVGPHRVEGEFPKYYRGRELEQFYYGHLHNNFIQIAAERGLLCLASLVWLFGQLARDLTRYARSSAPEVRWAAVSGLSVLTAFIVGGLFEYNLGDSEVFMLFLFLVSVPYGLARTTQST